MAQGKSQRLLAPLQNFADSVTGAFSSHVRVQPEEQLKRPVGELLENAGTTLGFGEVETRNEAPVEEVGRPDVAVLRDGLLTGYVELKAPGTGITKSALRGRNRAQFERFASLPNLLYTDGNEWALYRDGEQTQRVKLSGDVTEDGAGAADADDAQKMEKLLRDFLFWDPIVPQTPRKLAEMLAPLCHLLRDEVQEALKDPASSVSGLAREWREYLFPEADDFQFADAYAQTLTYALLLARFSGESEVDTDSAVSALRGGHALLSQALGLLGNYQARAEISLGVSLLERAISAVDPTALTAEGSDPWIYFYEDFLAAYDPRLRKDSGVYYTPAQVVRAQVRLISELLIDGLGKPRSFADEGVVVLDPAAGTGTYPLAVLQHAFDLESERYGPGMVASAASRMAANVHAFELMVGPYTVAHLRLSERISAAGGSPPEDGVRVYLTDTLTSPNDEPDRPPLVVSKLGEEQERALRIKRDTDVLVCLGNPPYDRQQGAEQEGRERKGGWVRYGDDPGDRAILRDFLDPVREAGGGGHLKSVYNDYVYFWRWALWKVFENKGGPGVVSFITAASYLRGPGFAGMRQVMRQTFDELWILDLEGDNLGARKTENVFDIQTPVAIAVGVRYGGQRADTPARARYAKVEGTSAEKLAKLDSIQGFGDVYWRDCFSGWAEPFLPEGEGDYFSWPPLTDIFPWQHTGVELKRTWPIGETPELLEERWNDLLQSPDRRTAFRETRDRKIDKNYYPLEGPRERLKSIQGIKPGTPPPPVVRYAHRSFDRRWILKDARLGDFMRPDLWHAYSEKQVYLTSPQTEVLGPGPAATACAHVPDRHHFFGRGGKDVIPLWRDAEATAANVTEGLPEALAWEHGEESSPQDLFCYAYAILFAPAYVETFSEELAIPGPRLPLTRDASLFREGVGLGRELIRLHTYGEHSQEGEPHRGRARYEKAIPDTPEDYPEDYEYREEERTLRVGEGEIGGVEPEVWGFSVSGLQVVKSWLDYRMRDPGGRSSSPLDEVRPERWTGRMTEELLEVIWALERTVELQPSLDDLLGRITSSGTFAADELPQPDKRQRKPPKG